jgi:hypothetical protein
VGGFGGGLWRGHAITFGPCAAESLRATLKLGAFHCRIERAAELRVEG